MADETASAAAAMQRLDVLICEWSVEAIFPQGPQSAVRGKTVFEWELGRTFVSQRSTVDIPEAPDAFALIAPTGDGNAYTQHYFDSRGVVRVYAMTFEGRVWTLARETPDFTPLDFSQRFVGTLSADGSTIEARWEACEHGSTWRLDFDLVYTKVG